MNILFLFMLIFISSFSCSVDKEQRVDQLLKSYSGLNKPGAVVMIIKDGQPIFQKAYGMAHLEKNIPVELCSNFRLASVTKQFTAMSIMMLAERAVLTYDQTLPEIFPGFPEYGKRITIRHLLQHTSGLIAYEDLLADDDTCQVLDKDVLQMMMAQDSTYFPPGTAYRYSNSGYAVLAMVIEKVSGKCYAEFLKENIFDPLEMENTVAYEKGISTVNHRAYGYANEDSLFVFRDQSRTSAVLGDGGIYSSILDLFKWDQALYTEKLVKFTTLELAFTSGVLSTGEKTNYGFGWRIDEYKGHCRVHHTGGTCGFATIIQRYPNDRFTVIILTNRDKPALSDLADRLTDIYL